MITLHIKCKNCNEALGRISKSQITDEDVVMYQESMQCSNGHSNALQFYSPSGTNVETQSWLTRFLSIFS